MLASTIILENNIKRTTEYKKEELINTSPRRAEGSVALARFFLFSHLISLPRSLFWAPISLYYNYHYSSTFIYSHFSLFSLFVSYPFLSFTKFPLFIFSLGLY